MNVSLEQWQALVAVVKQGGYAKAAEYLEKSQSTVSYAIQQIESNLNVRLFRIEGRKAVLTASGELLYLRALQLLASAQALEDTAHQLSNHWQAQINVAVDTAFPDDALFQALDAFSKEYPLTRVNLVETVLSGSTEALLKRQVNLAITGFLSAGFIADPLINIRFIAVAAPTHALHQHDHPLKLTDLQQHRQLVVRDSGGENLDAGWLGAEQRWSFSHISTSIKAATKGLGFAWYPEDKVSPYIERGLLKPLNLATGAERFAMLHLIYADNDQASLCCQYLGQCLLNACQALQEARA